MFSNVFENKMEVIVDKQVKHGTKNQNVTTHCSLTSTDTYIKYA